MSVIKEEKVKKQAGGVVWGKSETHLVPAVKLEEYVVAIDPGVDPVYGLKNPSFQITEGALERAQIEIDKFVYKMVRSMMIIGEKGERRFEGRREVVIREDDILRMVSKKRLHVLLEPGLEDLEVPGSFRKRKLGKTFTDRAKDRSPKRTRRSREDINPLLWA
jgi:hypothetical protein|eukprot:g4648.t1